MSRQRTGTMGSPIWLEIIQTLGSVLAILWFLFGDRHNHRD